MENMPKQMAVETGIGKDRNWAQTPLSKSKITKRTHFENFKTPVNIGVFQPPALANRKNEPIFNPRPLLLDVPMIIR